MRRAQVFPKKPETKQRPECEDAIDQRVLRHVDLRRRESHERANSKRPCRPAQSPSKDDGETKREHAEESGDGTQGVERFATEERMPDIT